MKQLKAKWKSIRDYYRDHRGTRNKVVCGKSGSGGKKTNPKEWPHFDAMEFMDKYLETRQ